MGERATHILVVDDDPDVVEADRLVLEGAGYRVSSASNGTEALIRLRAGDVDLVILDVMMAHPTEGFHLSYEMKDDPKLRELRLGTIQEDLERLAPVERTDGGVCVALAVKFGDVRLIDNIVVETGASR